MNHIIDTRIIPFEKFYYNRLFHDYIFDFPAIRKYFHYDYRRLSDYVDRISDIRKTYDERLRNDITGILFEMNNRLGASKKTLENITDFSKKDSVVVIGGQQPGLFTGPAFIIYKIITVIRLSSFIQETTGTRTIPCFWNASDDSNIEQANCLGLITDKHIKMKVDTSALKENTRLSKASLLAPDFFNIIDDIISMLPRAYQGEEIASFLKKSVNDLVETVDRNGEIGFADLFSVIILRLFSQWGLVIIDPSNAAFKKSGYNLLEWDIKEHKVINKNIRERGEKLKKEGYHAQLTTNEKVLDFFKDIGDIRGKIKILPGGDFEIMGRKYKEYSLLSEAFKDTSSISWNVVLRPIVQDILFPVAATICGPGEISYFAQLGGVYEHCGIKMPVIYPRFSATLVEDKIAGLMEKTGINTAHLGKNIEDVLKSVFKKDKPFDIESLVRDLGKNVTDKIKDLEDELKEGKVDAGSSFDRIKRNLDREISVLSKKLYSGFKRQNQMMNKNIEKIYLHLFPGNSLQEKTVNIFYYLNKYGMDMIKSLHNAYTPLEHGHNFIYLKGDKKDGKRQ